MIKSRMFRSCGDTMLDRAAKAGVWRSKFAPPRTKKGEGIGTFPYRVMVGVIFRLSHDIPKGWVTGVK